tara:strand:+ start:630 stop:1850 length:1221 start_codon:yes stop_codon:yes gene_type:complete
MKFSAVIPIKEKNTQFLDDLKNKISEIEIICVTEKSYDVEQLGNYTQKIIKIDNFSKRNAFNAGVEESQNTNIMFLNEEDNVEKINSELLSKTRNNTVHYLDINENNNLSLVINKNLFYMLKKFENDEDKDLVQNFISKSRSLDIEVKELTKEIKKEDLRSENFLKQSLKILKNKVFTNKSIKKYQNLVCFFFADPKSQEYHNKIRQEISDNNLIEKYNDLCLKIKSENISKSNASDTKIVVVNTSFTNSYLSEYDLDKYSVINYYGESLSKHISSAYDLCKIFADKIIMCVSDVPELNYNHINECIKKLNKFDTYLIPSDNGSVCCFSTRLKTLTNELSKTTFNISTTKDNFVKNLYNYGISDNKLTNVDTIYSLRRSYENLAKNKNITNTQRDLVDYINRNKYA